MVLSEPEGLLRIAIADLETEGVATANHEPLAQLTVYAVQFPWGWIGRPSTGR